MSFYLSSGLLVGPAPTTKDIFFYADVSSTEMGNYRVRFVDSSFANWDFNFRVPNDFRSLIALELVGVPGTTIAAANIDLMSSYGGIGESPTIHGAIDNTSTYPLTAGILNTINIAHMFASLAAGDWAGINVAHNGVTGGINYYGIRLRYNIL